MIKSVVSGLVVKRSCDKFGAVLINCAWANSVSECRQLSFGETATMESYPISAKVSISVFFFVWLLGTFVEHNLNRLESCDGLERLGLSQATRRK